ncbi:MAG: ATP-binding protein [Gammaproteobacteria bacterium]
MHFSITSKVAVGLGVILLLGMLSMLFIYRGLNAVERDVQQLADVEEPTSLAAYEVEINLHGMAFAILKYLSGGNPSYRKWAAYDEADVRRFLDQYLALVNSPRERELGKAVGEMFEAFDVLGTHVMQSRDEQKASFLAVVENTEKIDNIIDNGILATIDRRRSDALAKIEAALHMEAWLAEMILWTTIYQDEEKPAFRKLIFVKEKEFRETLTRFEGLDLVPANARRAARIRALMDETSALVREVLAQENMRARKVTQFSELRIQIDDLLDEEIQVLALDDLTVPRMEADEAADAVLRTTSYLIPAYILVTIALGLLLIRLINQPLTRLMRGTKAIGGGNLDYRIDVRGGDEFTDLARDFNRMVEQLQATLVSKRLLETSEANLHSTVAELRREIGERERAEQERARLQIELRRSETMSAMGALVAGVAHEVGNPLFGISATLDAMRARFKNREDVQRYTGVLRDEVDRLSRLMSELLDYGKPPALYLTRGSIEDSISLALQACAPVAFQAGVEIVSRIETDLPELRLDKASQVVQNLLQNAIQHSPPDSTISIEVTAITESENTWISCVVADSGKGLAEDDIARLFEPFFTRRRGGTGLGLAIVRRIVEEHGGAISAANRPEGGALMTVRLPAALDEARDSETWPSVKS